jgi:DNA-binding transcriptional LysR family regulator
VSRIGRSATQASQSLTLGAPPLIAANIVTHAIKEFRGHRPGLRIQLFDERSPAILQMALAASSTWVWASLLPRPVLGVRHSFVLL